MKDERVEAAISHWAPRFVANGVPLADFQEVTGRCERWEDWCRLWSARAAIHEELGAKALAEGYALSAAGHYGRAAVCYHFGKFLFVIDPAQMKRAHLKAVDCRNKALPYLRAWHERYAEAGLQVIGVHSPGYSFGRDGEVVERAVERSQSGSLPVCCCYLPFSSSRKAIASSSTRRTSMTGTIGRASNAKAGSIEQNL